MVGGVLLGLLARVVSFPWLAIPASLLLVGGGVAVAWSFREEPGRLQMAVGALGSQLRRSKRSSAPAKSDDGTTAEVTLYAQLVRAQLSTCEALLQRAPRPSRTELDSARESLMVLVANPYYGRALGRHMIDEDHLQRVAQLLSQAMG